MYMADRDHYSIMIGMTRVLPISFIRKVMDASFHVRRAFVTRGEEKRSFSDSLGDMVRWVMSQTAKMAFICMCGSNDLITNNYIDIIHGLYL
jgi:hypothetical protein